MSSITLADRTSLVKASGIRRIFDLAADLTDPVDLSIGQPDFDVPDNIRIAAIDAIQSRKNSYTPTQGCLPLREAIVQYYQRRYNIQQVLVTNAVSGGLSLSYLALLNPGDEILIPDPYFVIYKQWALALDITPVTYNTYPDWELDLDKIKSLITPRTKAIVIGSPANPTGAVYSLRILEELADLLRKHNIIAISDEIYSDYCYDYPFRSIGEVYPEGTIVLNGLSKSQAMTGWRIGWALGPTAIIDTMAKFQQFTFVCAPAPFQYAAITALQTDVSKVADEFRNRRDFLYNGLLDAGYAVKKPEGAFYFFIPVPWGNSEEFVTACIENNLLCVPGSVFSDYDTHFRLAYTKPIQVLEKAIAILQKVRVRQPVSSVSGKTHIKKAVEANEVVNELADSINE